MAATYRSRALAYRLPIYTLLAISGVVLLLPIAWMMSVSLRPNVEVLRIPPRWF